MQSTRSASDSMVYSQSGVPASAGTCPIWIEGITGDEAGARAVPVTDDEAAVFSCVGDVGAYCFQCEGAGIDIFAEDAWSTECQTGLECRDRNPRYSPQKSLIGEVAHEGERGDGRLRKFC